MSEPHFPPAAVKDCARCGGRAVYWETAIVPGDPLAPRGSHRGTAHDQPAWTCINCGFVEPRDRRSKAQREHTGPVGA